MVDNQEQEQPKYLTHDDLNGALASQKKEFKKIMEAQQQQFTQLLETFQTTFGPKPEAQPIPSKQAIAEDTSALKQQVKLLLEERDKQQAELKQQRLEKTLRDNLTKHNINSRSDLALKYLKDQVSYDEDGQLVMQTEITPGVVQPLPLHEAIAKFAQTDHGKFLADPKEVRGSGSRSYNSPTLSQSQKDPPLGTFKGSKDLMDYATKFLEKDSIKY